MSQIVKSVPAARVATAAAAVVRREAGPHHYEIHDFACRPVGGRLQAGDDAAEVAWVALGDLDDLTLSPGLRGALRDFGVLEG